MTVTELGASRLYGSASERDALAVGSDGSEGSAPDVRVALDGVQQRLFAVALGLRRLRSRCSRTDVRAELAAIEAEVDDLIRDVRAEALTVEQPS
jgi:hypothetical protein